MLSDDEITELQLAVEQKDLARTESLLEGENGIDLTGLQIFADHTLLMYACERGTPDIVKYLLEKGTQVSELEWSTNNELKSALRNSHHSREILELILAAVPADIKADMIETDWDPDGMDEGEARSPLEMARAMEKRDCLDLLKAALSK
jgi:ankyrin repeat protein